jgi:putative molybdopterin biosynthesis protein
VAVAVLNGIADVGLGIMAAARALDLDFIPVVREQYDLVIPIGFADNPNIELLLRVAGSNDFRERVRGLGGYDPARSGNLWRII